MARISHFLRLARALFYVSSLLGFVHFRYDNAQQSFEGQRLRSHWQSHIHVRRFLHLCLIVVYILVRVRTEMRSDSYRKLAGESLPPLSVLTVCEDLLDVFYYCHVCLCAGRRQQKLLGALNELQRIVRAVQQLRRECFKCPWLLLGLGYLLLGRMTLALLCDLGVLWIRSEEYEHWYKWEALAAVGLIGCQVGMQLHWLCHCLHFALQTSLCSSLNALLLLRCNAKRRRALLKLLAMQATVQQLQVFVIDYLAPSLQYLQLKTLLKLCTFVAGFRYDDVTLTMQEYKLDVAEELEAEKSLMLPLPPYVPPGLLNMLQKVQLVLLLAAWIALLFVAHAYHRERLLLKLNLLDVAHVEWAGKPIVLQTEEAEPSQGNVDSSDLGDANDIRSYIPKRNFLDVLLEHNLKFSDFAHDHVVLFKFYWGIDVHLDAAFSAVKIVIGLLFVMVLADTMHRQDILKLEKLSKMQLF